MYALYQFPNLFKTNLLPLRETFMSSIIFVNSILACILLKNQQQSTTTTKKSVSLKDFYIIRQFRDGCNVTLGMKMKQTELKCQLKGSFKFLDIIKTHIQSKRQIHLCV